LAPLFCKNSRHFIQYAMSCKQRLKYNRLIYYLLHRIRNAHQNRYIQQEQAYYECIGYQRGINGCENTADTFSNLITRLYQRGIVWPPIESHKQFHILYASLPGNWERHNIPPELLKFGKVTCFFLTEQNVPIEHGWQAVRQRVDELLPQFVSKIHSESPINMMLSYLSGAQISPETVEKINHMGIPTFAFHLDDRRFFRGYKYGNQWSGPVSVCKAYDLNLTNSRSSLIKYRCEGANALFWPEGANPDFFKPMDIPFEYEVSFCGQRYGQRPLLVDFLRSRGIKVACFGKDWEYGYQSDESLVRIFNASKINLGFGYVTESSDQCLKGRDFEVPACGALYLTSHNDDLERIYRIGTEIETYDNFTDCADKIKALLANPVRCDCIRKAARQAVLERHTWALRVRQLIDCSGVP